MIAPPLVFGHLNGNLKQIKLVMDDQENTAVSVGLQQWPRGKRFTMLWQ